MNFLYICFALLSVQIINAFPNKDDDMVLSIKDKDKVQFHQANFKTNEYKFAYEVGPNGMFHYENRGPDGATYGCYGHIDPFNILKITFYIADDRGYRVVQPNKPQHVFPPGDKQTKGKPSEGRYTPWQELHFTESCYKLYTDKINREANSGHVVVQNCGQNEQYLTDIATTEATCENPVAIKAALPFTGCRCKNGYLRNNNRICVTQDLCYAAQCRKNELYVTGVLVSEKTCDQSVVTKISQPFTGCRCSNGYSRNIQGICVLSDQCGPTCGENEYYANNVKNLDASCDNPISVLANKPFSGCHCKEGYLRNDVNKCIPSNHCKQRCGENEYYVSNVKTSEGTCKHPKVNKINISFTGCRCKDGYLRNDKNVCVLADRCTPVVQCQANERYDIGNKEPEEYCPNMINIRGTHAEGCRCDNGYYRSNTGKCVLLEYCDIECGKNERLVDGITISESTCDNPFSVKTNIPFTGCYCNKGYFRNDQGVCVPRENCGKLCNDDEYYVTNAPKSEKSCDIRQETKLQTPFTGCRCLEGLYRKYSKICVPIDVCDDQYIEKTCGQNEYFVFNVTHLEGTCINPNGIVAKTPYTGCQCGVGFFRNNNGLCVPAGFCHETAETRPPVYIVPYPQYNVTVPGSCPCYLLNTNPNQSNGYTDTNFHSTPIVVYFPAVFYPGNCQTGKPFTTDDIVKQIFPLAVHFPNPERVTENNQYNY